MRTYGFKRWQVQILVLLGVAQIAMTASMWPRVSSNPVLIGHQLVGIALVVVEFYAWNWLTPKAARARRKAKFRQFWSQKSGAIIGYVSLGLGLLVVLATPGANGAIGTGVAVALLFVVAFGAILQAMTNALDFIGA